MKEKRKQRKLPLGWIWLTVTLLAIGGAVFVSAYRTAQIERAFHGVRYANEPVGQNQSAFRKFLTELDAELTVPAVSESLTFTSPKTFTMEERFQKETRVRKGETLSCDFVSWSADRGKSRRYLQITYNGKLRDVALPPKLAAKLYMAALEQNGLSEQFRQETGETLGRGSAREALREIDSQIFDLGIYMPRDYPYDRDAFQSLILFTGGSASLVLLAAMAVLPSAIEYLQYQAFLVDYNRENSRRWKAVEGKLPQFVSLQENADGGKPTPVYEPPGFIQRMKKLFSPVVRE